IGRCLHVHAPCGSPVTGTAIVAAGTSSKVTGAEVAHNRNGVHSTRSLRSVADEGMLCGRGGDSHGCRGERAGTTGATAAGHAGRRRDLEIVLACYSGDTVV